MYYPGSHPTSWDSLIVLRTTPFGFTQWLPAKSVLSQALMFPCGKHITATSELALMFHAVGRVSDCINYDTNQRASQ